MQNNIKLQHQHYDRASVVHLQRTVENQARDAAAHTEGGWRGTAQLGQHEGHNKGARAHHMQDDGDVSCYQS